MKSRMSSLNDRSSSRGWLISWVLAFALHALALLGFRLFPPLSAVPAEALHQAPMDVVFTEITELPADREDEAPEQPEQLANVTSRARDQVPGGDAALPSLEGEGDSPAVALDDGGRATPSSDSPSPEEEAAAEGTSPRSHGSQPVRLRELMRLDGADLDQSEMSHPGGNAPLTGDVSLSTIAWDWSPWLQRFRRRLMSRWFAPPAYSMGILKEGGWAMVEVEITRSGQVIRRDLLDHRGHPSLTQAATSALISIAPVEPLPKDFPEETLILRIRMIYPPIRSR